MFKKLLLAVATLVATMGFAFAQVDVNKADQTALDGIKGIGPKTSKVIIDERTKGGAFKDWPDFEKRVKGVGKKNAAKLSQAGLTVNGQALADAPAAAPMAKTPMAKAPAKTASPMAAPAAASAKAGASGAASASAPK
ncbi:ComEA family DNA-binding protein [Undibacterium arcticum]|uniref:ComEA family DNA-binding protein n=1 Tax=Undibacterium arcticum TaxID=1762892 RepID=A0ABV7EWM5_9BURK